jgi:hypothetical protein
MNSLSQFLVALVLKLKKVLTSTRYFCYESEWIIAVSRTDFSQSVAVLYYLAGFQPELKYSEIRILQTGGRSPWTGDQPDRKAATYIGQCRQTSCLELDSKQQSQCLSGRRHFVPCTSRRLWSMSCTVLITKYCQVFKSRPKWYRSGFFSEFSSIIFLVIIPSLFFHRIHKYAAALTRHRTRRILSVLSYEPQPWLAVKLHQIKGDGLSGACSTHKWDEKSV